MNMRPAFHTIIPLTFAAISAGCASERNLVSDGEMWWSETFGASAHDASVAEADRIWSGNKTMQRTADDWSVVRAEDRANAAM
ncbi:MAG: hypothetical protein L6Q71_09160, partial [Planctomycetes bacterium]|nr:hypothetical protein [Planctomycetota bacterium]